MRQELGKEDRYGRKIIFKRILLILRMIDGVLCLN